MRPAPANPEVEAWYAYLEATLGVTGKPYEELEPWAWSRLQKALTDVGAKVYA